MDKIWSDRAWGDYEFWQDNDRKTVKKINKLIKDAERNPEKGLGHPEPLKNHDGYWSREINEKDRLVYKVVDGVMKIAQCRGHYEDK